MYKKINSIFVIFCLISLFGISPVFAENLNVNGIDHLMHKNHSPKIAVLDTGVEASHYWFEGVSVSNVYIIDEKESSYKHGTMVTGVLVNNLRSEYKEILPCLQIYSIVIGNEDKVTLPNLVKGIKKAIELKVDIINISACIYKDQPELREAIQEAVKSGILIVASVGNDYYSGYSYPASYDHVIAVTAVDSESRILPSANKNNRISVCAPGKNVTTAYPKKSTTTFSGTSAAAPFVSSLVCVLKYEAPFLNSENLELIVNSSVKDMGYPGKDSTYGYGLIEFNRAKIYAQKINLAMYPFSYLLRF